MLSRIFKKKTESVRVSKITEGVIVSIKTIKGLVCTRVSIRSSSTEERSMKEQGV